MTSLMNSRNLLSHVDSSRNTEILKYNDRQKLKDYSSPNEKELFCLFEQRKCYIHLIKQQNEKLHSENIPISGAGRDFIKYTPATEEGIYSHI